MRMSDWSSDVCSSDHLQNSAGAVQGPFDSFLALRGLKTLHRRMKAHCENAQALAEFLQTHPAIAEVIYPGLESHPHHELAKRQMDGFGGMLSIVLKGGVDAETRFCERAELFTLAPPSVAPRSRVGEAGQRGIGWPPPPAGPG